MGSFQHSTLDQIAKASLIAELHSQTHHHREVLPSFSTISSSPETWAVAFAPDQSYFAWSCGNRVVKLVPWDKETHNIYSSNNNQNDIHVQNPAFRGLGAALPGDRPRKVVTIPCKDLVWSLAFGWSSPKTSVRKHAQSNWFLGCPEEEDDLVLAIGLKTGKIKTYNVRREEYVLLVDHKNIIHDLKFYPDGSLYLVSASHDCTLKLWDLEDDGNMIVTLKGHPGAVHGCAISRDSRLLASVGEQRTVIVWDLRTFKILRKLQGHHNVVSSCEFSIDGALLATASYDTRVILWDPYTGDMVSQFSHVFPVLSPLFAGGSNANNVRDIAFSSDGVHYATVCDDNLVRVWSITCNRDPVLVAPVQDALSCAFETSGSVLAVGTRTGSVQFFSIPLKVQTLQRLCRGAFRRAFPDWRNASMLNLPSVLRAYLGYRDLNREMTTDE